ncbi:hypothetical protein CFN78_06970 [Amycolatopsis antarctica]|uniref:Uncharacterized protein n=2 Tax=Amycolatopsis antarctica TaxID=1854586 RepID=A0A263D6I7_9PSEU|nr:hypothetical protein CFN78_06970 [Amycolatopsis antarctica]
MVDSFDYRPIDDIQCDNCADLGAVVEVNVYFRLGSVRVLAREVCAGCAFDAACSVWESCDTELHLEIDPGAARRYGIEPPAVKR